MARKILLLTAILLIAKTSLFAQTQEEIIAPRPLNSINLNLLGNASLISIDYERQFIIRPTLILSGKLGIGYNEEFMLCIYGECPSPDTYLTIPHHVTGNIGKGKHFFEFGIGGAIINGNTTRPYLLYPIIGYRFLPLKSKKINFRIFGQIPLSGFDVGGVIFSPIGLNLGISF